MKVSKKKLLLILIPAVLVIAGAVAAIVSISNYNAWLDQQPKFHDLTVELGAETVTLDQFTTEFADKNKVSFACDVSVIDLNNCGEYPLTLSHNGKTEDVTLTVQDTIAPKVTFHTQITADTAYIPKAEDFVTDIQDADETTVRFELGPVIKPGYADLNLTVLVSDGSGNTTKEDCSVVYTWLKETATLEYGQPLTLKDVLDDPNRDGALVDPAALETISASLPGTYTLTSTTEAKSQTCTVTVQDTLPPVLQLQTVRLKPGKRAETKDFVVSCTDPSGIKEVRMVTQPDFDTISHQKLTFEAEDLLGHITKAEALLIITEDFTAPTISGAGKKLTLEKNTNPNFLEGVTATDKIDGACAVTVDTGDLDLTSAGTYEITYTAMDKSQNKKTVTREVQVLRNEEDTKLLVKNLAAKLSDDPEKLRNYVRRNIYYNHNGGGDDPVYHGFTKRGGNCYVHAMCLKALFDEKGIENQLIWTTKKSHYWLLVKIDGAWKHIDPTPGRLHSKYSLMSDKQRLSTLNGRKWDFKAWPACE